MHDGLSTKSRGRLQGRWHTIHPEVCLMFTYPTMICNFNITCALYCSTVVIVTVSTEENQSVTDGHKKNKSCYPKIGCLSMNGFWRRSVPRSPSDVQIEFNVITRRVIKNFVNFSLMKIIFNIVRNIFPQL